MRVSVEAVVSVPAFMLVITCSEGDRAVFECGLQSRWRFDGAGLKHFKTVHGWTKTHKEITLKSQPTGS